MERVISWRIGKTSRLPQTYARFAGPIFIGGEFQSERIVAEERFGSDSLPPPWKRVNGNVIKIEPRVPRVVRGRYYQCARTSAGSSGCAAQCNSLLPILPIGIRAHERTSRHNLRHIDRSVTYVSYKLPLFGVQMILPRILLHAVYARKIRRSIKISDN